MVLFWKTTAGILITVILVLAVEKQERDLAMVLCLAACAMAGIAAFSIWEPVLDFVHRIGETGGFPSDILTVLIKITGIGIVTEVAQHICNDSGNSALAHGMQLLGTAAILLLSLPILETLLELIQQLMGDL